MEFDWTQLLNTADEISAENVATSSKNSYLSRIATYERTLTKMQIDPYPITIDKMKGFLVLKMKSNKKYSTLANYIAAFSYYFRQNKLDILTNSLEFKNFKAGLRRLMHGDTYPNAKLPFNHTWFLSYLEKCSLNNFDDLKFIFFMALSFSAFLRISELMNFKRKNINLSDDNQILTITIESSKTDQFGRQVETYVYYNDTPWCPIKYLNAIDNLNPDDNICNCSEHALRSHLTVVLRMIGVEDASSYSWHSFRRGGAYLCGLNGVPDSIIKAHGRWKSSAYIRYVNVEMPIAGQKVACALSNIK